MAAPLSLFRQYEAKNDNNTLEMACKAALQECGIYRYIRTMPQYFEFALGEFISKKEGRLVTDLELYKLKDEYYAKFEMIGKMAIRLEEMILDLDKSIPIFEEDNSLTRITNVLVSDARLKLGSDSQLLAELP